jgi:hypothetical protein
VFCAKYRMQVGNGCVGLTNLRLNSGGIVRQNVHGVGFIVHIDGNCVQEGSVIVHRRLQIVA